MWSTNSVGAMQMSLVQQVDVKVVETSTSHVPFGTKADMLAKVRT